MKPLRTVASSLYRSLSRLVPALLLGAGGVAGAQDAGIGVAGTYRASPQRLDVQVVTWGEDCGPRPSSQVLETKGTVTVKEEGAHLSLRFPERTLKTNGCWSPNLAVKLISATSAGGRYRAECKTPAGDAKREVGRYAATAAGGKIELLEESEYDWQLKTSHCVAKLRMTQTLTSTRLPAPAPTPAPAVADPAPTPATPAACVPGTAARLRLRPPEAHIAPGERVCFSPRAVDAEGCTVPLADSAVNYTLVRPSGVQGSITAGCFRAAANAALAEGTFKVAASALGLHAEASVTVSTPDLSDITARRGPASGAGVGSQGAFEETALESGVRAVASGSHGSLWLGVIIASLAGVLSVVAIAALRVARRQNVRAQEVQRLSRARKSSREGAPSSPAPAPVAPARPAAPAAAAPVAVASGPQRICPRCRRGYPPGSLRCESDGETLLDYDIFAKQATAKSPSRHCPACGEAMTPDSVFCGSCGHKVTP